MDLGDRLQLVVGALGLMLTSFGTYVTWHTAKGIAAERRQELEDQRLMMLYSRFEEMGSAAASIAALARHSRPTSNRAILAKRPRSADGRSPPARLPVRHNFACHFRTCVLTSLLRFDVKVRSLDVSTSVRSPRVMPTC